MKKRIALLLALTMMTCSNLAEKTLKNEIQQRAIENGLLDEARSNAELVIQAFLSGAYDLQAYTVSFITEEGI